MKKYMLLFFTAMIVLLVSCTNDIKYKITFHPNNDDESYTIEVNDGSLLEKPTDPLKEGYDFEKWYQDESFTQEWNFETMHVEGDLNLYAKYTKKALKFNVHFETNDGSDLQSIQVDENGLINLPESPAKEGYLFAGWYKNESLTQAWNFNKDKVTKEMTLYAKWKPLKDFNEGIKILSIGNSFSEDAHRYLYQILESSGIPSEKIVVANMYIGGAELKQHLENANAGNKNYIYQLFKSPSRVDTSSVSIEEALLKESWDIITFQQASHHSGLESTYDPHLFDLMRYVEAMNPNPNTILGFHMTWAYQQTSTHSGFENYDKSQQKMYQMITDTVKNEVLPISQLQFVIPSGTAIQNARTSYIGDKLTADGYHLTDPLGRYIAALMFYRTLIGEELSLEKVEFRPNGVDKTQQLMAYEAVNNAFNKPFEVTNSTYLEAPEPEPIEVNGLPFSYTLVPGYWNTNATEITNGGSAFDLQFAASNVIPKALLPVGSEIVVEPGYKYRVIFFEKIGDQFKVVHRTDNITTSYTLIDEAFWGNYHYIGFNVSNTEGTVIDDILDTVLTKFRLYHPEGTELGHVDEDLEFKLGSYNQETLEINDVNHTLYSNFLSNEYFKGDYSVIVNEGYKFRYITATYDKGYIVEYVSDWMVAPLLLNDDFKSSFELIAFEVTKDEAVDLSEVESDEMISITPLLIPHVDQPINFIQGYWNQGATKITTDDTTALKFIASNVISKNGMLGAHSITIEEGYQVRVIFLSYDNYGNYLVVHRTNNLTGIILLNEELWQDYQYIAFNVSKVGTPNISDIDEVKMAFKLDYKLEFERGFWDNGATSIKVEDTTFNKQFIASKPVSRIVIPVGTKLEIETGYQVRIIFLSFDENNGFKVLERTSLNYQGSLVLNEAFYKDYQYIAFNISNIVGNTDLSGVVEETGLKLTLSKFDEILIEHEDNLEFIQGYWNDHTLAPTTTDSTAKNFVASTPISKAYFENIESFTVEEGYMVRVIYIDYSYNQYKVMLRTNTMTGTVLMDEAFWGNYQYIAFNISKSPASNIEGLIEETSSKLTFNIIN